MPSLLRPKALRPGDTVAIAALSGSLEEEEVPLLERAIPVIEALGFRVRLAPLVDPERRHWWMAARPEEMAAEFNELLRDPDVRAIFTSTGGRATLAYLDLIDLDAVRADPKPLLGFSDISVLDLALHGRTGLVTIHSELATWGFGTWEELPETQRQALVDAYRRILTSEAPLGPLPAAREWETWRPGRAEGPLIGGLLNRLIKVQATPFAVPLERFDGAILFWEEVRAPTPTIWYDLHALRLAGILDRIAGMVDRDADRHGDRRRDRTRCARSCSTSWATATSPCWATSTSATARQTSRSRSASGPSSMRMPERCRSSRAPSWAAPSSG